MFNRRTLEGLVTVARLCASCEAPLPAKSSSRRKYCSDRCRAASKRSERSERHGDRARLEDLEERVGDLEERFDDLAAEVKRRSGATRERYTSETELDAGELFSEIRGW